MLTDALIVLSLRQNLIMRTIRQDENRTFYARKELLYDNFSRRIAKHSTQHLTQFVLCLFQSW